MAKKASDLRSDDVVVDVDMIAPLVRDYHRINEQANVAAKRAGQLKSRIRDLLAAAGATVGRVNNVPVVYHRAVAGYVESKLKDLKPDLVDAYTVTRTVEITEVDWERLAQERPALADACRKRTLTLDRAGLDQVALMAPGEIVPGVRNL